MLPTGNITHTLIFGLNIIVEKNKLLPAPDIINCFTPIAFKNYFNKPT